ncbi:MAG: FAD-dependent oxidoreductase [Deltaproteobacteria bacterium]|nr:FAD-dependent oxidoreductase [Deltaproteobacteria bacterium]
MPEHDARIFLTGLDRRRFLGLSAATVATGLWPGLGRGATAETDADVIVIGAGLAGLVTARELIRRGVPSVLVLEARDRVGGRTVNLPIGNGHIVEGGGEWIGPGQDRIAQLSNELGIRTFPAFYEGDTTYDIQGQVSTGLVPNLEIGTASDFAKLGWKLDRMSKRLPAGEPWSADGVENLDRQTLGDWLSQQRATSFSWAVFRLITRAIMAGYPERISLLWFLYYLRAAGGLLPLILNDGGAQDLRFEGGSQLLSIRMAEALGARLRLGQPVQRIEHAGPGVRVRTRDAIYSARRVVAAMMPSDLLRIRFDPPLPPERHALAVGWARLPRLPIVKLSVIYETPFWRAEGLNGAMQSDRAPLQLVFDNSPQDGSRGVLSGFLSVTEAPDFADREVRETKVLEELARYFGKRATEPIGYVEKDWATDPFSTGCITPLTPGILSSSGPSLRRPVGRIHWAGTETAEAWCGYMDGAVRSGERAAAEVHAALRASSPGRIGR